MDVLVTHPYVMPEVRRGAERYLRDLVRFLRSRGYDVGVLTTSPDRTRYARNGVVERGRMTSTILTRFGVDPIVAFAPTMYRPIARSRARVVHALSHGDGMAAVLARRRGRAVVSTLMGIPYRRWNERTGSTTRAWRLLIERADQIICPSTFVAAVLESDYGRAAPVIPLGVDTETFRPLANRADPPTILFAGAMEEPRKGFDVLVEAFRILGETREDVRIVATGHGDLAPAHRLTRDLPVALRARVHVLHLGMEELPAAYSSASVTVLPSRHEALGLTLAESLACGTPVVGSDECGIVDVVDDPSIGRRFVPGDAEDLARALDDALELAEEPGIRDRCTASARRFDWVRTVGPAIEDVYRDVSPP